MTSLRDWKAAAAADILAGPVDLSCHELCFTENEIVYTIVGVFNQRLQVLMNGEPEELSSQFICENFSAELIEFLREKVCIASSIEEDTAIDGLGTIIVSNSRSEWVEIG